MTINVKNEIDCSKLLHHSLTKLRNFIRSKSEIEKAILAVNDTTVGSSFSVATRMTHMCYVNYVFRFLFLREMEGFHHSTCIDRGLN